MQILIANAPTFSTPLEMLRACHDRIRTQCSTLEKLLAYLPEHGCDTQARQAAHTVLRYFDTAGIHHHDDEEIELFPKLRATGNAELILLTDQLLDEHVAMNAAWQRLSPCLREIADGNAIALEVAATTPFLTAYEQHIERENKQLLPLAARFLTADDLMAIGFAMAKRRGVEFTG